MRLLPQRKTLVGYARKLNRAHSKVQIEILQESYTDRLTSEEIEVLDYLAHHKRQALDYSQRLDELAEEARAKPPGLPFAERGFVVGLSPAGGLLGGIVEAVRRGQRAQNAVDAVIERHERKGRG